MVLRRQQTAWTAHKDTIAMQLVPPSLNPVLMANTAQPALDRPVTLLNPKIVHQVASAQSGSAPKTSVLTPQNTPTNSLPA